MSAAYSIGRPPAASRESVGRTTIPSGTPITPSGIPSSRNALLNAVTLPAASVEATAVTTMNVSCVAPRPIARGAISTNARRDWGSYRSILNA